nr:uncharacterized protein LOC108172918 isoform X2 [Malus domestica]
MKILFQNCVFFPSKKIWAIRAQCKASCKYGKKPRHSSTQESLGSCTGPIQEFGDDGFMIWMVGSIVHLFSIGITFSAFWQPISTLHGVGKGLCVQQAKSFHSYELLGPLYLHNSLLTWLFFWLQNTIWRYHISLLSLSLSFSLYERCLSFFSCAPSGTVVTSYLFAIFLLPLSIMRMGF